MENLKTGLLISLTVLSLYLLWDKATPKPHSHELQTVVFDLLSCAQHCELSNPEQTCGALTYDGDKLTPTCISKLEAMEKMMGVMSSEWK
jgi:hypothetical protein